MNEWWQALSALQQVMFVIGAATLLFMIAQIVMMLVGLGDNDLSTDADLSGVYDAGGDLDADVSGIDAGDGSFDVSSGGIGDVGGDVGGAGHAIEPHCPHPGGFHALGMRLLSLRCIIAFFCFGSWVVFIMDALVDWYFALIIGVVAGFAAAVLMALIMNQIMKLQGDGTIKMKNCIGKEGEVYQIIPASREGIGKVNILIQERFKEFDAMTDDDDSIGAGETVRVVKVDSSSAVVVERVKDKNRQSRHDKEN